MPNKAHLKKIAKRSSLDLPVYSLGIAAIPCHRPRLFWKGTALALPMSWRIAS